MPLVSRTRATLRNAEFGFFGVWVKTRTQTPRFCGLSCRAGLFVLVRTLSRPLRTSWLIVGTVQIAPVSSGRAAKQENAGATRPRGRAAGFDVPGLGNRARAVRHRELTYPIKLLSARSYERLRMRPGARRPSRSLTSSLDRVS